MMDRNIKKYADDSTFGVKPEVVQQLRLAARRGDPVESLVNLLRSTLSLGENNTLDPIRYFCVAFDLSIPDAATIVCDLRAGRLSSADAQKIYANAALRDDV